MSLECLVYNKHESTILSRGRWSSCQESSWEINTCMSIKGMTVATSQTKRSLCSLVIYFQYEQVDVNNVLEWFCSSLLDHLFQETEYLVASETDLHKIIKHMPSFARHFTQSWGSRYSMIPISLCCVSSNDCIYTTKFGWTKTALVHLTHLFHGNLSTKGLI